MVRTKIICTIGPAVSSYEQLVRLVDAGMNVARINLSHGSAAESVEVIRLIKMIREERRIPLAIMVDTKGSEIRMGKLREGFISLQARQKILLSRKKIVGDQASFSLTPSHILDGVVVGMECLFDDGSIVAHVSRVDEMGVEIEIQNPGILKSYKKVCFPKLHSPFSSVSIQDEEDILFACENDLEIIAVSFIRSPEQLVAIRELIASRNRSDIWIVAKIEDQLGVENFHSIAKIADGIMIARGDLGVELPLEEIPHLQKKMIAVSIQMAKSVVTATQMLESMIHHPRPTRAEVSDVANAIYDLSSSLMLSGETAVGNYPSETVEMMRKIIEKAEKDCSYRELSLKPKEKRGEIAFSVAYGAIQVAYDVGAKAIFAFTYSGLTAQLLSCFRPEMAILALTLNQKVYHQMAFVWGVIPVQAETVSSFEASFALLSRVAREKKLVSDGDRVVLVTASPFWNRGATNAIIVESVGN